MTSIELIENNADTVTITIMAGREEIATATVLMVMQLSTPYPHSV